jgi:hypothetical protein
MKVTKESVESAITAIDELVDEVLEYCGKYNYGTRELTMKWSDVRETLASKSANIIASKGQKPKEQKRKFYGYAEHSSPMVADAPSPETVIELKKSRPSVRLVVRVRPK